jgi:hypothetical protein
VLCWFAFPLVSALGSTDSAADCSALFAGFSATMAKSDFPHPCIIGSGSSPSRCGPGRHSACGQTRGTLHRRTRSPHRVSREAKPGPRAAITISAASPRSGSRAPTIPRPIYLLGYRLRWPLVRRSASRRQSLIPAPLLPSTPPAARSRATSNAGARTPAEILARGPSCVSPPPQLKRELSLWPEFGWIGESVRAFKGIFCDDIF